MNTVNNEFNNIAMKTNRDFSWTSYIFLTLFYWIFGFLLFAFPMIIAYQMLSGMYPDIKVIIDNVFIGVMVVFQFWWLRKSARKAAGYVEAGLHPEDIPPMWSSRFDEESSFWTLYD